MSLIGRRYLWSDAVVSRIRAPFRSRAREENGMSSRSGGRGRRSQAVRRMASAIPQAMRPRRATLLAKERALPTPATPRSRRPVRTTPILQHSITPFLRLATFEDDGEDETPGELKTRTSWLLHFDLTGVASSLDRLVVHSLRCDRRHYQAAGYRDFSLISDLLGRSIRG